MNDIRKELDAVFQLLSLILIRGDAVDVMAAARSKLRKVQAELEKMDSEGGDTE